MPYNVLDPTQAAAAPTTTLGAPLTSTGETLSSISTELSAMLGNRDDIAAGRENSWINKAYRNVAGMLTISEIMGSLPLSFVTGQFLYALPVQVAWIKRLGVQDATNYLTWQGRELDLIDLTTYRNLPTAVGPNGIANAPPTSYFRHRRMVVIWPTSDNSYVAPLDFRVRPDDLVNATDSPLLPIEFHNAILLQARVVALSALLNWTDAMKARNDFVSEIKPLLNTDAEESASQYAVVAPVRSQRSLFRKPRDR
jgi:hypothetical protein